MNTKEKAISDFESDIEAIQIFGMNMAFTSSSAAKNEMKYMSYS